MSESIPSITQPYRLQPYSEEQIKKEAPKKVEYHVFQKYEKQLKSLGIPVPMEMMDYELTNFKTSVDESLGVERKVTTMVRVLDVDWLGDKKRKEFLVWYETWTGYSDEGSLPNGERRLIPHVVADFPCGLDKLHKMKPIRYDRNGNPIQEDPGPFEWVHTIEFKKELIDQILEDTTDTGADTIQFIVTNKSASYGGFSLEEFQNLTMAELEDRGKKGEVGRPVKKDGGRQQKKDGN